MDKIIKLILFLYCNPLGFRLSKAEATPRVLNWWYVNWKRRHKGEGRCGDGDRSDDSCVLGWNEPKSK